MPKLGEGPMSSVPAKNDPVPDKDDPDPDKDDPDPDKSHQLLEGGED